MEKKRKLNQAQLKLNLFTLLENTNKKFTTEWMRCQTLNQESCRFKECSENYQKIIDLVKSNNNTNYLLESYYLEAWLGKIQSDLNGLPQNPPNEAILTDNNIKIEELTDSLHHLNVEAKIFKLHIPENINHELRKDYQDLLSKINACYSSWEKTISQRKAAYYYNLAENSVKKSKEISRDNLDLKEILFKSIEHLKEARAFYEKGEQQRYAKETAEYQKKIEEKLQGLKKSSPPIVEKRSINIIPKEPSTLAYSSKTSIDLHPVEERPTVINNHKLSVHPKNLPFKKRKNYTLEETPILKKKLKTSFISANESAQLRKENLKDMLFKIHIDNPFRFYGKLFFKILQDHFNCLLKYKLDNVPSEKIYEHLRGFIKTHCKKQEKTSLLKNTIINLSILKT
jgi:hypothetical protein